MNSVHDQCPNSDSETILRQKLVKCTMRTKTAQPASPSARRHAQEPSGRVVATQSVVSQCQAAVSQRRDRAPARCAARHAIRLHPPCRAPAPPVPRACASLAQHLARPAPVRPVPQHLEPQRPACAPPPYAQIVSSPFQCLHHFFFLSSYWKIPKNIYTYNFFFHYPITQIILLKFIFFNFPFQFYTL